MNRNRLIKQLKHDEGVVAHAYRDSLGHLTIGVGHLIDEDKGGSLSNDEIEYILQNDIDRTVYRLGHEFAWFDDLSDVRQEVIVNMAFNLGVTGLKRFKNMIRAIEMGDWLNASMEALDSRWATQVGDRAIRLANAMRTNQWAG
jgi:lysozyme